MSVPESSSIYQLCVLCVQQAWCYQTRNLSGFTTWAFHRTFICGTSPVVLISLAALVSRIHLSLSTREVARARVWARSWKSLTAISKMVLVRLYRTVSQASLLRPPRFPTRSEEHT